MSFHAAQLLGCACAVSHKGAVEVIVLAVHPEHQGKGYGAKLMDAVENKAREKVTLGVPSCRQDVIPFFLRRGYKVGNHRSVGFKKRTVFPFRSPSCPSRWRRCENCTRTSSTKR